MAKLYIFGIGGTGSRVLRSLTMLMAAGVKLGTDEVVPVIIDPDRANADLTRNISLLNLYTSIRGQLQFTGESRFFGTAVGQAMQNYSLNIDGTNDMTFEQYIGLSSMSTENQALARMLFSERNLGSKMDVGFKGNPNIGSVVLNQIAQALDFQAFANSFQQGDRIFIISSIFGGTGASGFPLLVKTLRHDNAIPNFNIINQAEIGAITILPYFRVERDETSAIESSTFIGKAKSALSYYETNLSRNNSLNALYTIGDDIYNTYDNKEGGVGQKNAAHLIEFMAATAVVDFSNNSFEGTNQNMELGLEDVSGPVTFANFYGDLRDMLYEPLVRFTMMANALADKLKTYTSSDFKAGNEFQAFYKSRCFSEICSFLREYRGWLTELKSNNRSLDLFNLQCGDKPFELVTGVEPKRMFSKFSNYDLLDDRLNGSIVKSLQDASRFMEMFHKATSELVTKKLM